MRQFRAIVFAAAFAGLIGGLLVTALQQIGTAPLILKAEAYERASEPAAAPAPHDHSSAAPDSREAPAWEPADGLERTAFSAAANILTATGYALILCGAYALAYRRIGIRTGLLWGLAGFIVFVLAPGIGLPPKLPGMPVADLEPRQLWWLATALLTALALGLIAVRRSPAMLVLAVLLLAAPHFIGAPQPLDTATLVPAALSRAFAFWSFATGLILWGALGILTGAAWQRLAPAA